MKLKIIWASMFGNAEYVAEKVEHMAMEKNFDVEKDGDIYNLQVVDQIKELKDLYDKGIINEDEFKKAKEKLLK